jgi:hypothetical protein
MNLTIYYASPEVVDSRKQIIIPFSPNVRQHPTRHSGFRESFWNGKNQDSGLKLFLENCGHASG